MWKETPVIGSDIEGIPEQIEDGKTGYLVDPKNYREVADRVLDVLSLGENDKREMGRRRSEKIKKTF